MTKGMIPVGRPLTSTSALRGQVHPQTFASMPGTTSVPVARRMARKPKFAAGCKYDDMDDYSSKKKKKLDDYAAKKKHDDMDDMSSKRGKKKKHDDLGMSARKKHASKRGTVKTGGAPAKWQGPQASGPLASLFPKGGAGGLGKKVRR